MATNRPGSQLIQDSALQTPGRDLGSGIARMRAVEVRQRGSSSSGTDLGSGIARMRVVEVGVVTGQVADALVNIQPPGARPPRRNRADHVRAGKI